MENGRVEGRHSQLSCDSSCLKYPECGEQDSYWHLVHTQRTPFPDSFRVLWGRRLKFNTIYVQKTKHNTTKPFINWLTRRYVPFLIDNWFEGVPCKLCDKWIKTLALLMFCLRFGSDFCGLWDTSLWLWSWLWWAALFLEFHLFPRPRPRKDQHQTMKSLGSG